jgi:outer membrane protein assembly factor BamB
LRQPRVRGIQGNVFASPVAGDGKLFLLDEAGNPAVIKAGRDRDVVALNDLGESWYAKPAIVYGMILVCTERALYAFKKGTQASSAGSKSMSIPGLTSR